MLIQRRPRRGLGGLRGSRVESNIVPDQKKDSRLLDLGMVSVGVGVGVGAPVRYEVRVRAS